MGMGVINRIIPSNLIKNLVAYYRLDGDALDYSGNGYHPDIVQGITYGNGVVGQSAEFIGNNNRKIEIPNNTAFSFTDGNNDEPFSTSMWLYNRYKYAFFLQKRDGNVVNVEWQVIIYNNILGFYLLGQNSVSNHINAKTDYSSYNNQWTHITTTYDGSGSENGINIYINGILIATTKDSSGNYVAMVPTQSKVTIGNPRWTPLLNLDGYIQMVAIFDKELSATEVMSLYEKQQNNFLK